MAITGIDTIDGKQIIAAGAVSAKSAEMAYNDENGNPITGYLTAVPAGTMNESAFSYDASDNITAYNGSALAGGSYQPSGNYIPYTAVDSIFNAFKTNSGLKITTSIGGALNTNFINSNYITLQSVNSTLGINNQVILATGSLTLKTKSDSAYVDREKIHKWDSASDYIQNNSAALNEVSAKLDITAFSTVSGDFYTTANESGFISEVPAGTMNESAFEYDANDKISGYNGSAFAGGSDVPEGVMVESGLEYNAVNEISAYNGSAIAQYGAEKQWLVHDDTLVHAANSAQYALGVNLSAVAQLLGVDETVLFSASTPVTAFTTTEPLSAFNEVAVYVSPDYNSEGPSKVVIPMMGLNTSKFKFGWIGTFNGWKNIEWQFVYNNTAMTSFIPVSGAYFGRNASNQITGGEWTNNVMYMYKVIGIGRKQ